MPTLLISGRHDEATPATVQPYQDLIPDVRWVIFEESSHLPHLEEPELFQQVMKEFLGSLAGAKEKEKETEAVGHGVNYRTGSALVFPGMGPVPFAEVAKFMLVNPFARKLFAEADEALGYSLFERFKEAEGDYSEYAQVAFLVNCLALAQWVEHEFGEQPAFCAGRASARRPPPCTPGRCRSPTASASRHVSPTRSTRTSPRSTRRRSPPSPSRGPRAPGWTRYGRELDARASGTSISCRVDQDFRDARRCASRRVEWFQARVRAPGGLPLVHEAPALRHSAAFEPGAQGGGGGPRRLLSFRPPPAGRRPTRTGAVLTTGSGSGTCCWTVSSGRCAGRTWSASLRRHGRRQRLRRRAGQPCSAG